MGEGEGEGEGALSEVNPKWEEIERTMLTYRLVEGHRVLPDVTLVGANLLDSQRGADPLLCASKPFPFPAHLEHHLFGSRGFLLVTLWGIFRLPLIISASLFMCCKEREGGP